MTLTLENLAVERGAKLLFTQVNAVLGPGEGLALTGPNGVGKSSLLRAVAGLLPLLAGRVTWKGAPFEEPGEVLHLLGHLDGLKAQMTVMENLRFAARLAGAGTAAVGPALDRLGLQPLADLAVRHLSQGQRRRTALARLLLAPRPLWLLDEPTAGLDTAARAVFTDMLGAHLAAGGLAIVATHEPLPLARTLALEAAR